MQSPTVNSNDPRRPEKIQSYRMAEVFFKNRRLLKRESKESYVYIFGRCMSGMSDEWIWSPTRNNKYKAPAAGTTGAPGDDPIPDYMNVLSMIFSMCGLMMKLKWCAWVALFCSSISFANSRVNDDTKQILSSFMLSISAVVMSYLQNPQPMTLPWTS